MSLTVCGDFLIVWRGKYLERSETSETKTHFDCPQHLISVAKSPSGTVLLPPWCLTWNRPIIAHKQWGKEMFWGKWCVPHILETFFQLCRKMDQTALLNKASLDPSWCLWASWLAVVPGLSPAPHLGQVVPRPSAMGRVMWPCQPPISHGALLPCASPQGCCTQLCLPSDPHTLLAVWAGKAAMSLWLPAVPPLGSLPLPGGSSGAAGHRWVDTAWGSATLAVGDVFLRFLPSLPVRGCGLRCVRGWRRMREAMRGKAAEVWWESKERSEELEKWQLRVELRTEGKVNTCRTGGGRGCHWKDMEAVLGREGVLVSAHTGCGGGSWGMEMVFWSFLTGCCTDTAWKWIKVNHQGQSRVEFFPKLQLGFCFPKKSSNGLRFWFTGLISSHLLTLLTPL